MLLSLLDSAVLFVLLALLVAARALARWFEGAVA
jgi:hypothetical protein